MTDKELVKQLVEKMAKSAYQYADLIDDKKIDRYWDLLRPFFKSKWRDCAIQPLLLEENLAIRDPVETPIEMEHANSKVDIYYKSTLLAPILKELQEEMK